MVDDDELMAQRLFKALWANSQAKPAVFLTARPMALWSFLSRVRKLFKFYTQRKLAMPFRSPATAINFWAERSVERIVIDGLGHWKPNT